MKTKVALVLAAVLLAGVRIQVNSLEVAPLLLSILMSILRRPERHGSLKRCCTTPTDMITAQARQLLAVSTDGSCGANSNGNTCPPGNCCSQYGYCGSSAAFCAGGCQPAYGVCNSTPSPSATSAATPAPTKAPSTAATPAPTPATVGRLCCDSYAMSAFACSSLPCTSCLLP